MTELKALEKEARRLELDGSNRRELLDQVEAYTDDYLENLPQAKAYYRSKSEEGGGILEKNIQEEGIPMQEILQCYREYVEKDGLNAASGGHLAYIPGGGVYPGALGDFLAAVTNRYAGVFFANPGAVRMENMLIRWLRDLIGFPETTAGNLASGGSIATLTAIVTARDALSLRAKDFESTVIYLTAQTHHAVHKALRIAGLGEVIQRDIPMDDEFRMQTNILAKQVEKDRQKGLKPWMVVGSAGTTDAGAVDPLSEISRISELNGLWFHLDAAYGGFFLLSETGGEKVKGLNLADSIVMDPHKGLFLPYGLGIVLIKDGDKLHQSHYYQANYMQDSLETGDEPSPSELSPELTKHFRGLRMWLALQLYGLKPFRAALEEKLRLAEYFYNQLLSMKRFEVACRPDLSVVLFRYVPQNQDPDAFNKAVNQAIQRAGKVFMSSTTVDGQFFLRVAILSFRTHKDTIDIALDQLQQYARELEETGDLTE